ncbi:bifunctional phosphoribosyl-AMP cyclohydrolase/phosphoribosyl-ATP diphosphatase HisIE [Acidaminobacter sp. JC074]|uniref:bifunctional phosphoribosyl-AMP cyclohydrolase/phosphoribosyl-ATP diphosphatase HisIE n=1 Tax=Acidaminobacter sp. JC074 TaxID=2530199 RepID=UPI001F0F20BC|nr:bifunctional phosphoribosyl-AMP cyclohydrolase/phosphoribosyl-ATP diphosphatase HisIE [Acidaminobacter sp. JC074]MCH4888522.1 bifunctional phosphoribosyl-AMP cyclohydrolase/phosphoribosyl-ATP diphosphatase HisIE [Acidaminobacter sp. JC074]
MVKFENGLIPVITQDYNTKEVLILSYMNEEAYKKTLDENALYYYSRSRNQLWKKGETSGNTQELICLTYDCDGDALLAQVIQKGPACHTGNTSCFFNDLLGTKATDVVSDVFDVIKDRKVNPKEGSYTNYLFDKGLEKILKKVGEESSEVIIAAMSKNKEELVYELSDLLYHSLVLMENEGVSLEDIKRELSKRR